MSRKLSEHVEEELFNKEKRVVLPKVNPDKVIKSSEGGDPVKKKKPYYRKKYKKPTPVEVVVPELKNKHLFIYGLIVGSIVTAIITIIICGNN